MKVYVVNWFSPESYDSTSGTHAVYLSKEKALDFIATSQGKIFEAHDDGWGGWMISSYLEEKDLIE